MHYRDKGRTSEAKKKKSPEVIYNIPLQSKWSLQFNVNDLNYTSESTWSFDTTNKREEKLRPGLITEESLLLDSWERSTLLEWRPLIGGEEESSDWLSRRHLLCRLSAGTCYARCPPLVPCNVCSPTHAIPRSAWLHPLIALLLLF